MNRTIALLAALATLPLLAGCAGNAYGARAGDVVVLRLTATDLSTGATVFTVDETRLVVGDAALGFDLDHALLGARVGDQGSVESQDDPGRNFTDFVQARQEVFRIAAVEEYPRRVVPGNVSVGEVIPVNDAVQARVLRANETVVEVEYEILKASLGDPERGLESLYSREGDEIVVRVGLAGPPIPLDGPLGNLLPQPGRYLALGMGGGNLTFLRWADGEAPDGRPLRFDFTVLGIERGDPPAAGDAGLAPRVGPNLGRDPRSVAVE
jgi:FKBP-type peptidyl-prolyl cis-trans isomerase 2